MVFEVVSGGCWVGGGGGGEGEGVVQWNESSQAKSKGSSQCHKMNFSKNLDMVCIFIGLEGCPKLLYCQAQFQLASSVPVELGLALLSLSVPATQQGRYI